MIMGLVATTGFFDGVHKGHRAVLEQVLSIAAAQGKESAVISFWPHPRTVLRQDAEKLRLLNSLDEKKALIAGMGIQHTIIIPFNLELAKLSTAEFFKRYLKDELNVDALIVGHDHRLGSNACDDYEAMQRTGEAIGIEVKKVDAVAHSSFFTTSSMFTPKNNAVSSTKIREALKGGDIKTANGCLGYRYCLQGVVVEGNKLGRTLGFPTANMQLYEPLKQLPADGVYAVMVYVEGGEYKGIMNVGLRPTVGESETRVIEAHIMDFDTEIYGHPIEVQLLSRIREERRFDSLEELKQQIVRDKEESLAYFETLRP